ncbi:MAG TPA: class I SAM-dependent methyltransferase [Isosphaeraceae bacterium]|nr:class I SAM-dependent methyltransferase [Isosphaeraceae bacterium]
MTEDKGQDYQWSRHAAKYDDLFLDPFQPGVENPLFAALEAVPNARRRTAVDLGCGTGPLLPRLIGRFGTVVAIDFAPAMIERSRERLGEEAKRITFLNRPMHELDDFPGKFDVACAINSLVMPDVRVIDQTLRAIRTSLKPDGMLLGIVPAIDAIYYQTLLLMDQALDRGQSPEEAERLAAFYGEHRYYNFAFGRFRFRGLKQKFWQPFEIRHRLRKADFTRVELDQVLYPWDENIPGGADFASLPRSWDWMFKAQP